MELTHGRVSIKCRWLTFRCDKRNIIDFFVDSILAERLRSYYNGRDVITICDDHMFLLYITCIILFVLLHMLLKYFSA